MKDTNQGSWPHYRSTRYVASRAKLLKSLGRSLCYGSAMKRSPEKEAWLLARLKEAVEQFDGGSADAFGRRLGYTNGGGIRQCLNGSRPVQPAIIEKAHAKPELAGWFDFPGDVKPKPEGAEASLSFDALSPYEAALITVIRDGLSVSELRQLTESVKRAVKTKNLRVSDGLEVGEIGVYFGVDRRTHAERVPNDRREVKPWDLAKNKPPRNNNSNNTPGEESSS